MVGEVCKKAVQYRDTKSKSQQGRVFLFVGLFNYGCCDWGGSKRRIWESGKLLRVNVFVIAQLDSAITSIYRLLFMWSIKEDCFISSLSSPSQSLHFLTYTESISNLATSNSCRLATKSREENFLSFLCLPFAFATLSFLIILDLWGNVTMAVYHVRHIFIYLIPNW